MGNKSFPIRKNKTFNGKQRKATAAEANGDGGGAMSAEEGGSGPDQELVMSFNVSRADVLFLDYSIVADMRADQRGIEMDSSGEVSLRGRGGTPFGGGTADHTRRGSIC